MMSSRPTDEGARISVGAYKGIMLSNRPISQAAAPAAGPPAMGADGKPKPFVAGIVKERINPRGYDPEVLERKINAPHRTKPLTALGKHKKWLADLAKQREELKETMLLEELEKEERRQRFAETQKEIRDHIRGVVSSSKEGAISRESIGKAISPRTELRDAGERIMIPTQYRSAEESPPRKASSPSDKFTEAQKKKLASKKPAWAMTEEDISGSHDKEADELLEFVESLDFESFVDDLEVRAALAAARERIETLSERVEDRERRVEEAESKSVEDEEEAAVRAGLRGAEVSTKSNTSGVKWRKSEDEMTIAESVMSSASSIRAVHSKKSIQAVIDRQQARLATVAEDGGAPPELPAISPPLVAVTNDGAAGLEAKQKLVSQLGYLNRNPAV